MAEAGKAGTAAWTGTAGWIAATAWTGMSAGEGDKADARFGPATPVSDGTVSWIGVGEPSDEPIAPDCDPGEA